MIEDFKILHGNLSFGFLLFTILFLLFFLLLLVVAKVSFLNDPLKTAKKTTSRTSCLLLILLLIYPLAIGRYLYVQSRLETKEAKLKESRKNYERGDRLLNEGRYDSARGAFLVVIKLDKTNASAWEGLGDTLFWSAQHRRNEKDLLEAFGAYQKSIKYDSRRPVTHLKLAQCLLEHLSRHSKKHQHNWWKGCEECRDFKSAVGFLPRERLSKAKKHLIEVLKLEPESEAALKASQLLDQILRKENKEDEPE